MRYRYIIYFFFQSVFFQTVSAQIPRFSDSSKTPKDLTEIVITATKNEQRLSDIAQPVQIISKQTIRQNGSLRLNDILREQPGLFITNSFGKGVQMQGLNPDYTLILLDGEPLVGRTSGVLDLSRITLSNIKKIEIVKGPSSSLYGSEAMAGVINIITDNPVASSASASVRYGSFNAADLNAAVGIVKQKLNLSLQGNRYSTDGYKLTGEGQTQDPFHNYSLQLKSEYKFSTKTRWALTTKYFQDQQDIKPYALLDAANITENISGNEHINELNIINSFEHIFSARIKSQLRLYYTSYKAINRQFFKYADTLNNFTYYDYFRQQFLRAETQTDIALTKHIALIAGGGASADHVTSNRYSDVDIVTRRNTIGYIFSQLEWQLPARVNVTAGARYDHNAIYASHLSPKISIQKKIGNNLSLNASAGNGFKAPDFRQLYLNFTNSTVGYTVLGNSEVVSGVDHLQQQGLLQSILINPASIKILNPEISTGVNVGARYIFSGKVNIDINFFRNDIRNLVITTPVAQKTNGQFVYSYFNVNRAYTRGLEAMITLRLNRYFKVEGGYQLLGTADKEQLEQIKAGKVFGRDNGNVYKLTQKDYKGLFNRSRHMGNIKLYYENKKGWFATARNIYRSGWGVNDADGNLLLNRGDAFAKSHFQTNVSFGKNWKGLSIQAGSDNVFDNKDKLYLPEEPGRIFYVNVGYSFTHQYKK